MEYRDIAHQINSELFGGDEYVDDEDVEKVRRIMEKAVRESEGDSTTNHRLKERHRAWKEGAVCCCKGMSLSDNPHPSRSAKGDAWEEGWETIDMQLPVPDIEIEGWSGAMHGNELYIATGSDENIKVAVHDRSLRWKLYCKKLKITITDLGTE